MPVKESLLAELDRLRGLAGHGVERRRCLPVNAWSVITVPREAY